MGIAHKGLKLERAHVTLKTVLGEVGTFHLTRLMWLQASYLVTGLTKGDKEIRKSEELSVLWMSSKCP